MVTETSHDAWKREQETLARIKEEQPELLQRDALPDPDLLLSQIGILGLDSNRPRGYLRYLPQDFIVEEIRPDGTVCSIEPTRSTPDDHANDRRTLYCNLIKINLPTLGAIKYLSEATGLSEEAMGFAGSKDAVAITSQRISLRGVLWEDVAKKQIPQVVLEPITYGSGALQRGDLRGNRFTIFVRDDGTETSERLRYLVDLYRQTGFWNYFGLQRFGKRVLSHKLGCYLLRGEIDACLRAFFTEAGKSDLPLFRQLRQKLASQYGRWAEMKETIRDFPHTFSLEHTVLNALIADPNKTHNALRAIQDEVRYWVHAYASWVINRYLSDVARDGREVPERIPIPISHVPADQAFYASYFKEDGVTDVVKHLQPFRFISLNPKTILSRITPEVHRVTRVHEGVVYSFSLDKGAYATTYLMHLYRLHEGNPVPGWVRGDAIDTKASVRMGTLDGLEHLFGEWMTRRDVQIDGDED